ncbi:MAG: hypothetical protein PHX27_02205 [Candidatus ainarchaeum sp.]|nr:hypothetical protein [Candidatus ainarchaeum sp.]
MELKNFTLKPCSNKTSFEFLPKNKTTLDLKKISKKLNNLEINSKILLILKKDDATISIFKTGKILVRGIKDESKAREIVLNLIKKIN